MKTTIFIAIAILCFWSCSETLKSIEITNEGGNIPVVFPFVENQGKLRSRSSFIYINYKIKNNSLVDRYLNDTRIISGEGSKERILRARKYYNDDNQNLTLSPKGSSLLLKGGKETIVTVKLRFIPDSTYSIPKEYLTTSPDSLGVTSDTGDTIKYYSYKTIDELKKENPDFLDFYLQNDSIYFNFNDYKLPFYVKRTKYKKELENGRQVKVLLELPGMKIPILDK